MGEENKNPESQEAVTGAANEGRIKTDRSVFGIEAEKASFLDRFDDSHTIDQESADLAVREDQPVSSTVKEESAKPAAKEEVKASVPEGYVRKEALDEERSRRKRLSQKIKELEQTYESKFKDLETRMTSSKADSVEKSNASENAEVLSLQNKLRDLESRLGETEDQKQRKAVEAQQAELNDRIKKTDEALRKQGYPGFKLAVREVDEHLRELLANDEIDDVDYLNPDKWMEIYKDKVYPTVKQEFGLVDKRQIMEDKTKAKEAAARVTSATGIRQETSKKSEDESDLTPDQEREEYLRFKRESSPRTKFQ